MVESCTCCNYLTVRHDVRGEISLLQTVDIPEVDMSQVENSNDKIVVPVGLKQRWKPFGWSKLITIHTLIHSFCFFPEVLKCDGLF